MINVSPYATNVIDLIGKSNLVNANGETVSIEKPVIEFIVKFNGTEVYRSRGNLEVSNFLNSNEIRYK